MDNNNGISSCTTKPPIINNPIVHTPLEYSHRLSSLYGANIYLKREDKQIIRSFKIRGVWNKLNNENINMDNIKGIVCASAGNHAQAVAYAGFLKNINTYIFVPRSTPGQKINRIKYFGFTNLNLFIEGNDLSESLVLAQKYCNDNNMLFIHPFDDSQIIEGQGNIYDEIIDQSKQNKLIPDTILVPVGGGGLVSGIISHRNRDIHNNIHIIGVEPDTIASMSESLKSNKIIDLDTTDKFADGVAVKKVGELTYNICSDYRMEMITISNKNICYELLELYQQDGIIVEPAGAVSIAGLAKMDMETIKGKNIVLIISGGNNDPSRYNDYMNRLRE